MSPGKAEKINASCVSRVLRLTLLAPDIVEAIPDGRQAEGVTLVRLIRPLPVERERQRKAMEVSIRCGGVGSSVQRMRRLFGRWLAPRWRRLIFRDLGRRAAHRLPRRFGRRLGNLRPASGTDIVVLWVAHGSLRGSRSSVMLTGAACGTGNREMGGARSPASNASPTCRERPGGHQLSRSISRAITSCMIWLATVQEAENGPAEHGEPAGAQSLGSPS